MKTAAFARSLFVAALLMGAAGPAAVAAPAAGPATALIDNPAQHPTFTVRVVGKGRPMLLIPGLNCPGAVWDEAVAHYQKQYQCHVISLAGFAGTAPTAVSDPLLTAVRDQLLAYINTQKLERPVIMGHSLGGFLALWMSSVQPAATGPLVIVDSLPFLPAAQNPTATVEAIRPQAAAMRVQMKSGPTPMAARRQMLAGMVTDTARMTLIGRWGAASDPATTGQAMYDMYTTDLRADVARIQQPVLVLGAWAAYQAMGATKESTKSVFTQQYAKLPQTRIEMSEAGRHFLMYDDTAWFFAQTDAFLKQPAVAKK